MNEVNKEAFGQFLTQMRKEKGWTQKDLAERLYVSDKAVSKWERGLSLPDISLLIPLADSLGVGVTELLEGKRSENPAEAENAEILVKKALSLAEDDPEQGKKSRQKRARIFAAAAAASVLEYLLGGWALNRGGYGIGLNSLLVYEVLGLIFGLYFWCFLKEKLPGYYDENRIGYYADGFLKLDFPGVRFHNGNWPRVVKALRIWSVVTVLVTPLVSILASLIPLGVNGLLMFQMGALLVFLGGLFIPIYLTAREPDGKKRKWWAALLLVGALVILVSIPGIQHGSTKFEIGSVSSTTAEQWAQKHYLLSGKESVTLHPKQAEYVVQVETEGGTLTMEIQDETGVVFSETDIQTGEYPISLHGKTRITATADGHRGSFAVVPKDTQ